MDMNRCDNQVSKYLEYSDHVEPSEPELTLHSENVYIWYLIRKKEATPTLLKRKLIFGAWYKEIVTFVNTRRSFILKLTSKCFFVVMIVVDPESILGTLGMTQEFTLNGIWCCITGNINTLWQLNLTNPPTVNPEETLRNPLRNLMRNPLRNLVRNPLWNPLRTWTCETLKH